MGGCESHPYFNSKMLSIYKQSDQLALYDENLTYIGPDPFEFLPLYDEWRRYFEVPVSLNASVVHVPINIYDCSK